MLRSQGSSFVGVTVANDGRLALIPAWAVECWLGSGLDQPACVRSNPRPHGQGSDRRPAV